MIASHPLDLVRPLLWIAVFAFAIGFSGYLFLGAGSIAQAASEAQAALSARP